MEHLKQLYGAAALGVAAVLFAGISGTEVMAQELENAADKAAPRGRSSICILKKEEVQIQMK